MATRLRGNKLRGRVEGCLQAQPLPFLLIKKFSAGLPSPGCFTGEAVAVSEHIYLQTPDTKPFPPHCRHPTGSREGKMQEGARKSVKRLQGAPVPAVRFLWGSRTTPLQQPHHQSLAQPGGNSQQAGLCSSAALGSSCGAASAAPGTSCSAVTEASGPGPGCRPTRDTRRSPRSCRRPPAPARRPQPRRTGALSRAAATGAPGRRSGAGRARIAAGA